ncbi:MAG: UDP-N-acetylmuramate--L-alanine ligase [Candidatus Neomarinimicrobiota bacterium]|nr:UDP-N-acetylmuramate--L-alanine ligase [Candidatus Neomarinimicrobiota bacterium]
MFGNTKRIHFVGIGGIGMSGMAELLHCLGFEISGSDQEKSDRTNHLQSLGIDIFIGHNSNNIINCDVLVYSSAVDVKNEELIHAKNIGIPVIRRAEMLGELMKVKKISIGVSGTHGKTTSSSLLGNILEISKMEPTLVIGGIVNKFNTNAISGSGDVIVVEADEFDKTFLQLSPTYSIINNLDLEHLDCYKNIEDLQSSFIKFANSVPFYGKVAICIDDKNTKKIISKIKRPIVTFGLSGDAYYKAKNIKYMKNQTTFDLHVDKKFQTKIILNIPGKHNIQNALGAIAISHELNLSILNIKRGLEEYTGVRRRFQIVNKFDFGTILVDDYAHHPTEVEATLDCARKGWNNRIVAVFQPHLYSRTRDFHKQFAKAFLKSDITILTDIYAGREDAIEGVHANLIIKHMKKLKYENVFYVSNKNNISKLLKNIHKNGDLIIVMGAGDIWRQIKNISEELSI